MIEYKRLTERRGGLVKKDEPLEEIERLKEEKAKLKAENASLRERLDRSVESPCKVGDIIYFNTYDRCKNIGIQPHKVKSIRIVITTEKSFPGSIDTEIYAEEIGDCVFLDKDQAEEWLKELQEKEK